jgi:hypothetical protein
MREYSVGGLYSCNHRLELWKKSSSESYFSELIDDMAPNKPFVVLEVDCSKLDCYDIFQLKVLTSDGIVCWIDVGKTNTSIQSLTS